jgi:prefoldin alpha subunit
MNEKTTSMVKGMIQQIQQQLERVEMQLQEFETVIYDINQYTKIKVGSEILTPISNGIFVKATATDNKTFTVNIGANTLVDKTAEQTIEIISGQIKNLETFRDELLEELDANYKRL